MAVHYIVVVIFLSILLILGTLCITTGFVIDSQYNSKFNKNTCILSQQSIKEEICRDNDCQCDQDGCYPCEKECYICSITLCIYNITDSICATHDINRTFDTSEEATLYLKQFWPDKRIVVCYNEKTDQTNIILSLKDTLVPFVFGIVFCSLFVFFTIIVVIVVLIRKYKTKTNYVVLENL